MNARIVQNCAQIIMFPPLEVSLSSMVWCKVCFDYLKEAAHLGMSQHSVPRVFMVDKATKRLQLCMWKVMIKHALFTKFHLTAFQLPRVIVVCGSSNKTWFQESSTTSSYTQTQANVRPLGTRVGGVRLLPPRLSDRSSCNARREKYSLHLLIVGLTNWATNPSQLVRNKFRPFTAGHLFYNTQMPSGNGKKGHPFAGRLTLKGNPSRKRKEKRGPLGFIGSRTGHFNYRVDWPEQAGGVSKK